MTIDAEMRSSKFSTLYSPVVLGDYVYVIGEIDATGDCVVVKCDITNNLIESKRSVAFSDQIVLLLTDGTNIYAIQRIDPCKIYKLNAGDLTISGTFTDGVGGARPYNAGNCADISGANMYLALDFNAIGVCIKIDLATMNEVARWTAAGGVWEHSRQCTCVGPYVCVKSMSTPTRVNFITMATMVYATNFTGAFVGESTRNVFNDGGGTFLYIATGYPRLYKVNVGTLAVTTFDANAAGYAIYSNSLSFDGTYIIYGIDDSKKFVAIDVATMTVAGEWESLANYGVVMCGAAGGYAYPCGFINVISPEITTQPATEVN
jgi:hypothetical protein